MTSRLKKHFHVLKVLQKARPKKRKEILESANKDLVYCLCECIVNVLNGNVPTTAAQKQKIRRHGNTLKEIKHKQTSLKQKKKLFIQRGGFLPMLLAPIIGIVGGLIGDLVSNAIKK